MFIYVLWPCHLDPPRLGIRPHLICFAASAHHPRRWKGKGCIKVCTKQNVWKTAFFADNKEGSPKNKKEGTAQHSTTQHNRAQHSTAQHSSAQDSTAQNIRQYSQHAPTLPADKEQDQIEKGVSKGNMHGILNRQDACRNVSTSSQDVSMLCKLRDPNFTQNAHSHRTMFLHGCVNLTVNVCSNYCK